MYIGVIGPSILCEKFRSEARNFPELVPVLLAYDSINQAPGLVQTHQDRLDALFFVGPSPYLLSLSVVPRTVPWFALSLPTGGILAALLQARKHIADPVRFSLDSIDERDIHDVLEEAGLDVQSILHYSYHPTADFEHKLVSFHSRCYAEGSVDFCLTCHSLTHRILTEQQVPTYFISPTRHSMRDLLTSGLAQMAARQNDHLRTVCGLYVVENMPDLPIEERRAVQEFAMNFASGKNILFVSRTDSSFQSISTWGQFLGLTDDFRSSPVVEALRKKYPILRVRAGYGLSTVVATAEEWATKALEMSLRSGTFGTYLFDGQDYRLMGEASTTAVKPSAKIAQAASKLNLSAATLTRYLRSLKLIEDPFSAREFANVTGLRPQASRKIFSLLLRGGILQIAGKRPAVGKGRPEMLYRPTFSLEDQEIEENGMSPEERS